MKIGRDSSGWAIGGVLLAAMLACATLTGCESFVRARAFEHHAPLREGSLAWWIPQSIENEDASTWLLNRAAVVVGRADSVGLLHDGTKSLKLKPTRGGESVDPSLGSAVALTEDGYFLTAAHCVSDEPFVIVLRDPTGQFVEQLGRTVWSGFRQPGQPDFALVHAAGVRSIPVPWCGLSEAGGGVHIMSAGVGVGAPRLAGGQITGRPIGGSEAPAGKAWSFTVDSPLIPGDSGGPAIVPGGRLLGICATVEIGAFSSSGGGTVLRPDPAFIDSLISTDRTSRATGRLGP